MLGTTHPHEMIQRFLATYFTCTRQTPLLWIVLSMARRTEARCALFWCAKQLPSSTRAEIAYLVVELLFFAAMAGSAGTRAVRSSRNSSTSTSTESCLLCERLRCNYKHGGGSEAQCVMYMLCNDQGSAIIRDWALISVNPASDERNGT